jgi:hypothetical protein
MRPGPIRLALLVLVCLALAACATGRPDSYKRDRTLYAYASAIRWGDIEGALAFIDPALRAEKTPGALELKRYEQVQIAGYNVRGLDQPDDETLHQTVELRLVNRHTQVERSVLDRQRWRWDRDAKRWWLVSGLPDIAAR